MGESTIPHSATSISRKERLFVDVDLPKCFGVWLGMRVTGWYPGMTSMIVGSLQWCFAEAPA
jgi:hypothetical protein